MLNREHRTVEQRREYGKSLRKTAPRLSHADWAAASERPDPIELLEQQNEGRVEWLVPIRRRRMMASPFAFYRAAARIMATDLAATPVSGLMVQACGDAHLANFGLFASPERKLVFDLNDFDETLLGPWEWDLKRLTTSVVIAARHNQLGPAVSREASRIAVTSYRQAMRRLSEMSVLDMWYSLVDEDQYLRYAQQASTAKRALKTIEKAKSKDSRQALNRFAEQVDGQYRIKSQPPLLIPLRELGEEFSVLSREMILESYEAYKEGVAADCRVLLERYQPVDFAIKVVGVGSVGTRCWIMLLEGRHRDDPLFLQMKQATESVLAEHLSPSPYSNHGRRVVEGQRLMQTVNDILLGWTRFAETGNDYYWRQLRDWKGSVDTDAIDKASLKCYAKLCGATLARAHARAGDPTAIAAYLGSGDAFAKAMVEFSDRYADQNQRDYDQFMEQVRSGRLAVADQ